MSGAKLADSAWGRKMNILHKILLASAAGLALAGAAQAADLPTRKAASAAEKPNCYASFYTWLDSTAADCPLSLYGITFYGQVDVGGGYETHATKFNKDYSNGVSELIAKTSGNAKWQWVPNGLSQSNPGPRARGRGIANSSIDDPAIRPSGFSVGPAPGAISEVHFRPWFSLCIGAT